MSNTIIIDDPKVYQEGELFAQLNHSSLKELVNKYVASLAAKVQVLKEKDMKKVAFTKTEEFEKAMQFMDSFVVDDLQTPVPLEEDGKGAAAFSKEV